ncbi:amino acid dehydrogenase [Gammaproteobacteria bacterium]|jgi:leucine dehydrogenase|nr:amino acid dehydrogenase [Gammaproteobacteria bacterium]MDA9142641.1 amino acid dehydrogenase [Gammaproteobacteria bacterium]MDA9204108.1 amino acid dehydrogenase [Gammaproteobacteria bacterium]MDA9259858.1 amino acid dehydrogenase [Gammaproteobacteria bacterium]MDA9268314.1 amino acid dehydrogenase [Gammaproteobacteria bacterium]
MKFLDITDTLFNGVQASSHIEFDHEKIFYCEDDISGLKSIIAIHSSKSGPAIGGCRFRQYQTYEEGLTDVLRLSRGMTEKNNAADIPFGGGKAIIFSDKPKSTELLVAFASFLNQLEGIYYSAEDMGISLEDIQLVGKHTPYVFDNVDPGSYTAKGIFYSIQVALKFYLQKDIKDSIISLQGAGSVGSELAKLLGDMGATIYVQDIDQVKLQQLSTENIHIVEDALTQECDLLSPCAVGGIFTESSIQNLGCKIIAGGANNQLLNPTIDSHLHKKGIRYIPDVLINSGGVIGLTKDILKRNDLQIEDDLKLIGKRALDSMSFAKANNMSVLEAIDGLLI